MLMQRKKWLMVFFVALIGSALIFPGKSYAYLDPGSGSYILQLIIAGLVASSFAVKTFWKTVKDFFTGMFFKKKTK